MENPETPIPTVAAVEPVVAAAEKMGLPVLTCSPGRMIDVPPLAYLTFADPQSALIFLAETARRMDYKADGRIILDISRPLSGPHPAARVAWHPRDTEEVIAAWAAR